MILYFWKNIVKLFVEYSSIMIIFKLCIWGSNIVKGMLQLLFKIYLLIFLEKEERIMREIETSM